MNKIKRVYNRLHNYIYNPERDLKDRSFVVFSTTVLIGLFFAIPIGLILHEPFYSVLATAAGIVFFTVYVAVAIKTRTIRSARVVVSILLIFIFLPLMFFSNGGIGGGMPIWLLLGTVYVAMILDGKFRLVMLIMHLVCMLACWIVGYYYPELVLEYTREGNYFDTLMALLIVSGIIYALISFKNNLSRKEEQQKNVQRLFEQTAMALVNAIDAKDKYTHGHSARVAEYSRKIAEEAGKTRSECDTIYYMALLHDVGKIGIPESIINKVGILTEEEYRVMQTHPTLGGQILENISEFPYLAVGAKYHHERYDGKGYPEGLKGTDIPEFARIISVADAYDAMTSKRSYRDPIPQQKVREEFVKGIGTQFDPEFGRIMLHLIDLDIEYEMKEREEAKGLAGKGEFTVSDYRSEVSDGVILVPNMTTVTLRIGADKTVPGRIPKPSMILFDSIDGRYHDDDREIKDMIYYEYCELTFDGTVSESGSRKVQSKTMRNNAPNGLAADEYRIEALKVDDHARVRIISREKTSDIIVALPDSSRYVYVGFTGERCHFGHVKIEKSEEESGEDAIPRIAPKISYIDVPAGDIPNIQLNGYRTVSTDGIEIKDGMSISFHAKGLPAARLVWHCPFINIFSSDDGKVNGPNFRSYSLMRLDGECWEEDGESIVFISANKTDDFEGWDAWKKFTKDGFDCTVTFERTDDKITVRTVNGGIYLKITTEIHAKPDKIYAALSGDQCAVTNIRITEK